VKLNKTALTFGVSAALVAGASYASIRAVPGEALLVPFSAADYGEATGPDVNDRNTIHTAVILTTPAWVGNDTILNGYTMPNTKDDFTTYNAPAEMTVHWTVFDDRSKEITNGTFDMTPNDVYLWSPPDNNLREYIGYVVFSDDAAVNGTEAATFAMAGNAFMLLEEGCEELGDPDTGLCVDGRRIEDQNLTLPVVPMSDGVDYCMSRDEPPVQGAVGQCAEETGKAHLAITYMNNVVALETRTPGGATRNNSVGHVSPLVAAVRTQAPFSGDDDGFGGLYNDYMVNGLFSHYDGNWTHVFWFSENAPTREADPWAYDDEEVKVSCPEIPMPNELHGIVYADEENRVYDLIKGFKLATDNDGSTRFEDACLTAPGSTNCAAICGTGSTGFFGWPKDGFTQAAPGIGIMEYSFEAGPTDTSTAVFFQFLSNLNWNGDYDRQDIAVGRDFDVYDGGYQDMTELGKF